MVPAPPPAASRRVLSLTTTVAAALLLAVTGTVTPAHASQDWTESSSPSAQVGGQHSEFTSGILEGGPRQEARETTERAEDAAGGTVQLEASATIREGATKPTRKPKVVKRAAEVLVYYESYSTPDTQRTSWIELVQDLPSKRITVTAPFFAPPTASANSRVAVFFGRWNANRSCQPDFHLEADAFSSSDTAAGAWYRDGSTAGTARRVLSGSTLTVTLTGSAASRTNIECVFADVYESELDANDKPVLLGASDAWDFEAEMERAPEFEFYSSDLVAAYPGKWQKIGITVRNDGNLVAKKVRLRLSGKNLTFKKKNLKVGKLKAGARKTVTARVKLKGKKTRTLKAKATANGGWKATTKMKVGHRPHPKKVKNLNGRTYWAHFTGTSASQNIWQVRGLHFVNKKWAYVGNRPEGSTPKCSAKIKECFRYTYNRSKGQVRIGKIRGKVNSEGIQITKAPKKFSDLRKLFFTPLAKPKKNAKLKVKLAYYDGSGLCTPWSCRSWWRHLELKKNGSFTWTRGQITTVSNTTFASSGPDYEGKYKILSKGRIRFTFTHPETGKRTRETHTIGIDANALGKHKPKHGLLIGAMPHT